MALLRGPPLRGVACGDSPEQRRNRAYRVVDGTVA